MISKGRTSLKPRQATQRHHWRAHTLETVQHIYICREECREKGAGRVPAAAADESRTKVPGMPSYQRNQAEIALNAGQGDTLRRFLSWKHAESMYSPVK